MEIIDVKILINAPVEQVFNKLSDHAGYANFKGIKSAKLLKTGDLEKNGKGAVRQINAGITFVEEIPTFERNQYFEYKVVECFINLGFQKIEIPLHHELGRVTFKEKEGITEVNWISIIELKIPFLKDMATKVFSFMGTAGFFLLLHELKQQLENSRESFDTFGVK